MSHNNFLNETYCHKKSIKIFRCSKCNKIVFLKNNIGKVHLKYAILCFSFVLVNLLMEIFLLIDNNLIVKNNLLRLTSHFSILMIFYIFNNYVFKYEATEFDNKFEDVSACIYKLLSIYFGIMFIVNILEYKSDSIVNLNQMQFIKNKELVLLTHTFLGMMTIQNIYHVSRHSDLLSMFKKVV